MKNTLFAKTTASDITTIRPVLHPFVKITLYYLEKLRNCYINWIHFVSRVNTWTVFILCSSADSAEKFLQRVKMCLTMCRAISFNQRNRRVDKKPSIAKKKLLRKNFKQLFMIALQKNKSTQANGSVFAESNEKVKKTKFEMELIKIVDCFLDGLGSYDRNLVSFK